MLNHITNLYISLTIYYCINQCKFVVELLPGGKSTCLAGNCKDTYGAGIPKTEIEVKNLCLADPKCKAYEYTKEFSHGFLCASTNFKTKVYGGYSACIVRNGNLYLSHQPYRSSYLLYVKNLLNDSIKRSLIFHKVKSTMRPVIFVCDSAVEKYKGCCADVSTSSTPRPSSCDFDEQYFLYTDIKCLFFIWNKN